MVALADGQEWRSIMTERRLEVPFNLAGEMLAGGDAWLPEAVGLDGVFAPVHRHVEITLGPVTCLDGVVRRHLAWRAAAQPRLFPVMEGSVTILRADRFQCVLEVRAHYQPPLGRVGQFADRALMHVVASSSIERFADEIARRLTRSARQADAEPEERQRRPEDQG